MNTLHIQTLKDLSLPVITATFNAAFKDYFIPLQFTEEGMATKMKTEGILLEYSVGAFNRNQLVGFILHAYDTVNGTPTVYNAGTGVIAAYRGQGITTSLYQYSIPYLKKAGVYSHVLEVISTNQPAIKIYEKNGFVKQRHLGAFKNTGPITSNLNIAFHPLNAIPTDTAFHSIIPAWQNASASIERDKDGHCLMGAYLEGVLVGYAAFVPATARVKQLAVHDQYRRRGIGRALMAYANQACQEQPLVITNVDESNQPAMRFLKALQFQKIIGLYEMKPQVLE